MSNKVVITPKLIDRCEKMAKRWMRKNKGVEHDDVWDSFLDYDINLYVEDNTLCVTAYPLEINLFGDTVPVTDGCVTIVVANWKYPR